MKDFAMDRPNSAADYDAVYLKAGLMAGTTKNLLRVITDAGIGKEEDDQAVLTEQIVLEYGQTMFGNNRGGLGGMADGSCTFSFATALLQRVPLTQATDWCTPRPPRHHSSCTALGASYSATMTSLPNFASRLFPRRHVVV